MNKIKIQTILLCWSILSSPAIAQVKISALPSATTPLGGTEIAPIVQGGTTSQVSVANLRAQGANPTGTAGPAAVNGSATTYMRSDGAPAVQKASAAQFGIVETDGSTITPTAGVIACTTATTSQIGCVKPDGTTVTISGGTISAVTGGTGTVTSVATGAGLTGGTITTSGTISATYVINAQTGTTYTVLSTDASKLVTFSNSNPIAVTVPQATGSFAAGFSFDVENLGAGLVTLTPTTSTVNGAATLTIPTNYGCTLVSDGTNWQVSQCTAVIPKATASTFGLSEPDNVTIKATAGVYADQYPTSGDIMVSAGNGAVPTGIVPGTGVTTALADNTNGAGGFCVIGANACAYKSATIGWIATVNPNNAGVIVFPAAGTLVSIVGNVETATGSAATVSINVASSGTACSAGTTVHSGSFNANGTAATNQTLTLTTTAITSGQRLCLQTTGTTSWTGGTGVGTLTVTYTIP